MPSETTEIRVPDIGDFQDVPVIEIHVSPGDEVALEDPLVTLESDKATMDVPAPQAGTVTQLCVKVGDRVSEGSVLLSLESDGAAPSDTDTEAGAEARAGEDGAEAGAGEDGAEARAGEAGASEDGAEAGAGEAGAEARAGEDGAEARASNGDAPEARVEREPPPSADGAGEDHDAQVVVIGSGPGGYTAAFRAADLGLKTVLIERYDRLGGVCLNVGCIPSKALLHAARVVSEAEEMAEHGIKLGKPKIDVDALRDWKQSVVKRLTGGLDGLAKQRKVEVIHGRAALTGPNTVSVGDRTVSFDNCIIAAGSEAATIPGLPEDERIFDSTGALELPAVPKRLLVVGGGIIGLEMATVYHALGSRVTVVEMLDQLIPGCDPDLVKPLHKRISARYEAIHLETKVESVEASEKHLQVKLSSGDALKFDGILVAIGRRPNGRAVGADEAGVEVDDAGFISVDRQLRTNVPHIYAIGDVVGGPMLAHKASHEGKVAAEVIAGESGAEFDPRAIPSVAYTDPEVAWMGLTETEARQQDIGYEKGVFPWAASGRALSLGRDEGMTKLLFESGSRRLLGAGIVGVNAGELIAETVHALEMGADAEDIGLTIHAHPTLGETVGFAAEMADGTITDLMPPRKRERAKA